MTSATQPEPVQPSTRTGTTVASLATPYMEPASVPETWVPWPTQSWVPRPSSTPEYPAATREPNSNWLATMPVSITYAFTPRPVRS